MSGVLGITGTPGTGKKSVARLVALELGVKAIAVDELARSYKTARSSRGELVVDTAALRRKLTKASLPPSVVYGHLLPHAVPKEAVRRVAVLRTEPTVLKARLEARGYPKGKVIGNVEAELIGLVSAEAFGAFGTKVFEADTTYTSAEEAAALVAQGLRRRAPPKERTDWGPNYDSGRKLMSLLA